MERRHVILAAALAALAAAPLAYGQQTGDKEKCYGIAKKGQNDCADAAGVHTCARQAKSDYLKSEWKYVAKGTCAKEGGSTTYKKK